LKSQVTPFAVKMISPLLKLFPVTHVYAVEDKCFSQIMPSLRLLKGSPPPTPPKENAL
jgi:hypothetical protein